MSIELKTASGKDVFPIGVGTFGIASWENPATRKQLGSSGYKNVEPVYGKEEEETAGLAAWMEGGANYIDTAELYGAGYTNEIIGRAMSAVSEIVPRGDLFVSGNVWKSSYDDVRQAVGGMVHKLGAGYLDVAGLHSPHTSGWDVPEWRQAIKAFRELKEDELIHGLSVSNFSVPLMKEAMDIAELPITTAQMGFGIGYRDEVTPDYLEFCEAHGIQVVAYQPLKSKSRSMILENETIQKVAHSHRATSAQIALAWAIHKGTLPITKTTNPIRITENLAAADLSLTPRDMDQLENVIV